MLWFISLRYDHKETVKLSCLNVSERHYKSGKWLMDDLIFDSKVLFVRCQTLPHSFLFLQPVLWSCTSKLLLFSCRYKWRGCILWLKKREKKTWKKKIILYANDKIELKKCSVAFSKGWRFGLYKHKFSDVPSFSQMKGRRSEHRSSYHFPVGDVFITTHSSLMLLGSPTPQLE